MGANGLWEIIDTTPRDVTGAKPASVSEQLVILISSASFGSALRYDDGRGFEHIVTGIWT